MDKFLTTKQLANRWGVHEGTLRNWRSKKLGPPYYKMGTGAAGKTTVQYKLDDVVAYEKSRQVKVD